ncbi:MAG: DedA family protein [Nanoarchaeota archaeon]
MFRILIEWLEKGGLPFLFLLMLLEGNPIIGSFIPGQTIVIFIGFLISTTKIYNLYVVIVIVFLGALIGDILGYFLGRKYGVKGLKRFGLDNKSKIYKYSYYFFKKYGLWSIIMGRQINFTRAFMPFFAGCFKMAFFPFFVFAFISCLLWSILSVYLGYYFGFIIVENLNFVMEFIIFVLVYFVIVFFGYRNIKNIYYGNFSIMKQYSLHNIIFLGIISLILIFMGYLYKWEYSQLFNDLFVFAYFSGIYLVFGFLFSKFFLFFLFFLIFLIMIYKRYFRLLVVYLWSLFISFLLVLTSFIFFKIWYGIRFYFDVIFFTIFLFFLWILCRKLFNSRKQILYINLSVVLLILIMVLVKFSMTQNIFLVLFSFLVGVLNTEIILLLSHYYIIDNYLSKTRFDL